MNSTRIAFFLYNLAGGGAERVAVNLGGGLLERSCSVDFVLAHASGALLEDIPPGARLIDLHAARTLTALPGLAGYLRREKPYALISMPDHTNLVALLAGMLSGSTTRVIITHHIHPSASIRNTPKLQEKLYPHLLRIFRRRAASIIAVSNGVADDLARLTGIPRQQIEVIYNPVVTSRIEKLAAIPLDHPWFANGQPPVVLAVGRLEVQKDYPTLLQAFALVHNRIAARLVILGEGQQRDKLQDLAKRLGIAEVVALPGFVSNPFTYMAHCRVVALSSTWEGLPTVLVEAMACGAQLVSTDCPSGPAEILENGKYGRLVPVGDPDALAIAIQTALDHPVSVDLLRRRAQAFSVEAATEKYLQAIGLA